MILRPYYYDDRGCAAYLFGCGTLGQCAVVDARADDARGEVRAPVQDGQVIALGNTHVRVLHTPGHSPESVCLVVTDRKRGSAPWFVLTGDTLFVGAVGRPDLPGRARENAAQLYASIHKRLLTLPDDLEIDPAHFSGSVCGAGLSGKPSSTIAFERRWNPMLSMDRDAFVEALANVPPKPDEMEQILACNRDHAVADAPG